MGSVQREKFKRIITIKEVGPSLTGKTMSVFLGKCHLLPGGGLLKIGGIRYFFLDQKGGSKDFSNKKGDHLYFLKNKIFC